MRTRKKKRGKDLPGAVRIWPGSDGNSSSDNDSASDSSSSSRNPFIALNIAPQIQYENSFKDLLPATIDAQLWENLEENKGHYGQWKSWIFRPAIAIFLVLCGGLYFGEIYLKHLFDQENSFEGNPPSPEDQHIDLLESQMLSSTVFVASLLLTGGLYYLASLFVKKKNVQVRGDMYTQLLSSFGIYKKEHLTPPVINKLFELISYLGTQPHGGLACARIVSEVRRLQEHTLPEVEDDGVETGENLLYDGGDEAEEEAEAEHHAHLIPRLLHKAGCALSGKQLSIFWQFCEANLSHYSNRLERFLQLTPLPFWPTLRYPLAANKVDMAAAIAVKANVPITEIEAMLRTCWPYYERQLTYSRYEYGRDPTLDDTYNETRQRTSHALAAITKINQEKATHLLGHQEESLFFQLRATLSSQENWQHKTAILIEKFCILFNGCPTLKFTSSGSAIRRNWPLSIKKDSVQSNRWPHHHKRRVSCLSIEDLRPALLNFAYRIEINEQVREGFYRRVLLTTQSALLLEAARFFNVAHGAAIPPDREDYRELITRIMLICSLTLKIQESTTLDIERNAMLGELIADAFLNYAGPAGTEEDEFPVLLERAIDIASQQNLGRNLFEPQFQFNCIRFLSTFAKTRPRNDDKVRVLQLALKMIFHLPAHGMVRQDNPYNWKLLYNLHQDLGDNCQAEDTRMIRGYKRAMSLVCHPQNYCINFIAGEEALEFVVHAAAQEEEPPPVANPAGRCSRITSCLFGACKPKRAEYDPAALSYERLSDDDGAAQHYQSLDALI